MDRNKATGIRQGVVDSRRFHPVENLRRDLIHAARSLRRSPAFATTAALSLALGIGVTTAIFTLLNAVAFRPLPYSHPQRLVWMTQVLKSNSTDEVTITADFLEWRQQNHTFTSLAAYNYITANLTGLDQPIEVHAAKASSALLPLLGVQPILGRNFLTAEDYRGPREHVAILAYQIWQQRFGADPNIIGRPIVLDGQQFRVVGLLPRDFVFPGPSPVEIITPLGKNEAAELERNPNGLMTIVFNVLGRLKPGVTLEQARADISVIQSHLPPMPFHPSITIKMLPLRDHLFGNAKTASAVLLAAAGFLLLIASANVSNLLLVRLMQRDRELAIRTALGGSRTRIISQLLTEGLLLGAAACSLAILLAYCIRTPLMRLSPYQLTGLETLPFDGRVLGFAIAIGLFTTLLFGLMPAFRATEIRLAEAMKAGQSSMTGARRSVRVLSMIAIAEISAILVLSNGAALLLESFWRMRYVNLGFQPDRLIAATLNLSNGHHQGKSRQLAFMGELLERARALPGVESAAITDVHELPPGDWHATNAFDIEGRAQAVESRHRPIARQQRVSAGYFDVTRIPLLQGRFLQDSDGANTPLVTVVNHALVHRYFEGENPLGRRIRIEARKGAWYAIVGVAGDVKTSGLSAPPEPAIYLAYSQAADLSDQPYIAVLMRSGLDPGTIATEFRTAVSKLDLNQPVASIQSMNYRLSESVSEPRFTAALLLVFAGLAALLGIVGVYGVMAYRVRAQVRELAVRQAVGAKRSDIVSHVLRQAFEIILPGLCFGLLGFGALARILSSMLYEVKPNDPAILTSVSAAVLCIAALASCIPAMRAATIDPVISLREE